MAGKEIGGARGDRDVAAAIRARRIDLAEPVVRIALAHLLALALTAATLLVDGHQLSADEVWLGLGIGFGFALLRTMTVRKRIVVSTLLLDAAGTVIFLTGTGAPISPFYPLALAGVWWAAHLQQRRSGLLYGAVFGVAYLALVVPQAIERGLLAESVEDSAVLLIVAGLSDWFVRLDKRALRLNDALTSSNLQGNPVALRHELQRVLGIMDVPVDVVLAAAEVGLTVVQAELLAYLVLGLTNREIAEATHVSEATVRYRLTRLYRVLRVTGRRDAVRRAIALGLSLPEDPTP